MEGRIVQQSPSIEPMPKYGFNDAAWEIAKAEGGAALAERAGARDVIAYSDFIQHVRAITFKDAQDPTLKYFLAEISIEEDHAGRGMLTALVVHKQGDYMPGSGFFELAEKLGRSTRNIEKCSIEEVNKVFASWEKPK